jgi:hypothetical protein
LDEEKMNNEFTKIKSGNYVRYVLEDGGSGGASSGGTSSGSIASMDTPIGKDQIVVQSRMGTTEPAKPRNFVAKNAKMGGAGKMKDKSKTIPRHEKHKKPVAEEWSQKYKSSINCSHPKGFSQKAHCAGKKKHEESMMTMEAVCPDCGMCQTHGNVMEIKKGQKDANGFTRCWPGKHAVGTKKGKNGGQVRNCEPNEGVAEGFNGEYDDEAGMAHSNLLTSARAVLGLLKTIKDRDNLPEWGQEKIAKAEMMLVSVWDYLQSQKEQGIDPKVAEGYGRNRGYQHGFASPTAPSLGQQHRDHDHGDDEPQGMFMVMIDGRPWKEFTSNTAFERAKSFATKNPDRTVQVRWPSGQLNTIKEQGVAEGDSVAKYKIKQIGSEGGKDYYISPNTGKKVYKTAQVGDHETPNGEHKPKLRMPYKEGDYNDYLAGILENLLDERSKSKAQWDLMHAVAHNPQFANQVKINPSVGQEFAAADAGHERSALPDRVLKTKSKKK